MIIHGDMTYTLGGIDYLKFGIGFCRLRNECGFKLQVVRKVNSLLSQSNELFFIRFVGQWITVLRPYDGYIDIFTANSVYKVFQWGTLTAICRGSAITIVFPSAAANALATSRMF